MKTLSFIMLNMWAMHNHAVVNGDIVIKNVVLQSTSCTDKAGINEEGLFYGTRNLIGHDDYHLTEDAEAAINYLTSLTGNTIKEIRFIPSHVFPDGYYSNKFFAISFYIHPDVHNIQTVRIHGGSDDTVTLFDGADINHELPKCCICLPVKETYNCITENPRTTAIVAVSTTLVLAYYGYNFLSSLI